MSLIGGRDGTSYTRSMDADPGYDVGLRRPRAPSAPIDVTVLGGYLGAGKTTLVNHLLRGADGEQLAVLVNDFGAIAVDAELIEARDGATIRLANGCICCSLAGGFAEAMTTIDGLTDRPDRLLIEASGVADPAAVAQWAHLPGFALDGVVVLADAETVRARADDRLVGRHVRQQLAAADVLVVNKTDLVPDTRLAELHAWLTEVAPGRVPIDTVGAAVDRSVLLGPAPLGDRRPDPNGDPGHRTFTLTSHTPLDRERLSALVGALPDRVVRAKGIVALADDRDRRWVIQRVGPRTSLAPHHEPDPGASSHLVVIALPDQTVDAAVEGLRTALFTDPEAP